MRDSAPIPTLCAVLSAMLLAACWASSADDAELRSGPFSGADAPLSPLAQRAVEASWRTARRRGRDGGRYFAARHA